MYDCTKQDLRTHYRIIFLESIEYQRKSNIQVILLPIGKLESKKKNLSQPKITPHTTSIPQFCSKAVPKE